MYRPVNMRYVWVCNRHGGSNPPTPTKEELSCWLDSITANDVRVKAHGCSIHLSSAKYNN